MNLKWVKSQSWIENKKIMWRKFRDKHEIDEEEIKRELIARLPVRIPRTPKENDNTIVNTHRSDNVVKRSKFSFISKTNTALKTSENMLYSDEPTDGQSSTELCLLSLDQLNTNTGIRSTECVGGDAVNGLNENLAQPETKVEIGQSVAQLSQTNKLDLKKVAEAPNEVEVDFDASEVDGDIERADTPEMKTTPQYDFRNDPLFSVKLIPRVISEIQPAKDIISYENISPNLEPQPQKDKAQNDRLCHSSIRCDTYSNLGQVGGVVGDSDVNRSGCINHRTNFGPIDDPKVDLGALTAKKSDSLAKGQDPAQPGFVSGHLTVSSSNIEYTSTARNAKKIDVLEKKGVVTVDNNISLKVGLKSLPVVKNVTSISKIESCDINPSRQQCHLEVREFKNIASDVIKQIDRHSLGTTELQEISLNENISKLPHSDLVDSHIITGDCHTQPQLRFINRKTISLPSDKKREPSELELMFMKMKDKKRVNDKKDKKSNVVISHDKKDKTVSDQNKNESPSISKLLKPSRKDSPIKKKEYSRVKRMVLELEKPMNPKSKSSSLGKAKIRKNSVDQNQSKITRFLRKNSDQDFA